ncbi:aldolase/citrate lyase family protein [Labilibaculum antarcticum]|uniref:Citrate lyase ACP n=1 Tax=Labilibaculum antarcticum TaxID=1717717 RepID=A0A1Y1CF59_9BACT|nr:aldolase/citrate lyase family protein [Labilibaculum antarcticum]BAX78989.1 citrate lyase ACP [Labilibaculum antarcticum]
MELGGQIGTAGNFDANGKGDCFVSIELKQSEGIIFKLESKVKVFYGKSIEALCRSILSFFSVENALVVINDSGALPYVIAARLESAIKQVVSSNKDFLFDFLPDNLYKSNKDQFRFSRLYLPGNTPYMMLNAGIHKPNGIILDLEDAVAVSKKNEARYIVRNALRSQNFYGAERMVRINQGQFGLEDLTFIVPHNVHLILIPKCESRAEIDRVEEEIAKIKQKVNLIRDIFLMPIIETALGVENAYEIASASRNIVAMAIGLEDYTADLGVQRTNSGAESLYGRMRVVNACHAAKIQAIDSVFSDVGDMQALAENVKRSKSLGFQGMGCIHPRQISVIHENFAPNCDEIERAKKIVNAFYEAESMGLSVVSVGTKMVDPPVVKRQLKVLELAINLGILPKDWRSDYVG